MPSTAHDEYAARVSARSARRDALTARDARFAHLRLLAVAGTIGAIVLVWRGALQPGWLAVPVATFAVLMHRHDRVIRAREHAVRAIAVYQRGVARLEDRWRGTGATGDRFRDDHHVYANDLDLFGSGSLFELLSTARTAAGEATLAAWLTTPASAPEIAARQPAVQELSAALDLREQLAVAGADVASAVQTDRLLDWAAAPMPASRALDVATWGITLALAVAIAVLSLTGAWWPLTAILFLQFVAARQLRAQANRILSGKEPESTADFVADDLVHRARDLDVLASLLTVVETYPFAGERLQRLRQTLTAAGVPASRIIRRLQRYAEVHNSEKNTAAVPLTLFLFAQFELALMTAALLQLPRPHVTLAVRRWRSRHGAHVRAWLQTVADFEALTSLAAYRYEHPADPFPEIVTSGPALFEGVQLGHPLLPAGHMVCNDVRLGSGTQLLVVSGSNMSGKSTLLRTVGANAVLALAGAPVRASSLKLSPVALGATLRIQDSLVEGRSRFYAEISRIRRLAEIASGPLPLLFLLDELFHGTNSHDRVAGAAGVLRSLLDRGAIGLITTHDLAVTAVAEALAPRAINVHFQDWFDGAAMKFDYLMKPGRVSHSNALALMRAVGLQVDAPCL